jgi:hypothetical protein
VKPKTILWGIGLVCSLIVATRAVPNLWNMFTDFGIYRIPEGSSIFTFRPIEMNSGNGNYWISGEDSTYYYYFEDYWLPGDKFYGKGVLKITKVAAKSCEGFIFTDVMTWCIKG